MGEPGLGQAGLQLPLGPFKLTRCQAADIGHTARLAGAGTRYLLGAYGSEFALDVGADRGRGPEGLQAPRELVAVLVQLAVGELDNPVAVIVRWR
jgi:hypothetical protein